MLLILRRSCRLMRRNDNGWTGLSNPTKLQRIMFFVGNDADPYEILCPLVGADLSVCPRKIPKYQGVDT